MRIIPPQDQRKRILNKSSCRGENAVVRAKPYVLYERVCVCVCVSLRHNGFMEGNKGVACALCATCVRVCASVVHKHKS